MITVIGCTPVDLIAPVSDAFLERHGLTKGICTTISLEQQDNLLKATDYRRVPGGSGANTAASLALLGQNVHFIGPFGRGDIGDLARQSLVELGVDCCDYTQDIPNQIVFTFLTEDGDRSFAAFYHPNATVPADLITPPPSDFILVDGYTLLCPLYRAALLQKLPTFGSKILFCPNDVSVIEEATQASESLYNACSHVVLNRNEAKALLQPHKTETIMQLLTSSAKTGALTAGAEGAYLFENDQSIHIPSSLNADNFIDSNGAGDAFTAGYLYGLVQKYDNHLIGKMAAHCAAAVLATSGARPPADLRARVLEKIA